MTIQALLDSGAITVHKDGNHGSNYPRVGQFGADGVPFLTAKLLCDGKIDIGAAPRLADNIAEKMRFGFVEPGDVLLSHNATIGRVAVVPEFEGRLLVGTSLTYFRPDPTKLSPRYLAACFAGPDFQTQLMAVMSHTTRNQVPITEQRRLYVVMPPHAVQEAVAAVLGALDEKIDLNDRTNETSESIVQALFKSWFVDFDPVHAKMAGRQPEAMDAETAALFPSALEESNLGLIPEGWGTGSIADIADNVREQVDPREIGGDRPYLGLEHLPRRRLTITEHGLSADVDSAKALFRPGDILFGKLRPNFHKVSFAPYEGVCSTDILVIRPQTEEWFGFALCLLSSDRLIAHAVASSDGTKMPRTSWGDLARFHTVVPPRVVAAAFQRHCVALLASCTERVAESTTLAALRDVLLPKLLTGELRIANAERSDVTD